MIVLFTELADISHSHVEPQYLARLETKIALCPGSGLQHFANFTTCLSVPVINQWTTYLPSHDFFPDSFLPFTSFQRAPLLISHFRSDGGPLQKGHSITKSYLPEQLILSERPVSTSNRRFFFSGFY